MGLTDQQRAQLEALGLRNVELKLASSDTNPGGLVKHIVFDAVLRRDIDAWVAEQSFADAKERAETLRLAKLAHDEQGEALRWAKIAGWAALAAAGLAIIVPLLQWLTVR